MQSIKRSGYRIGIKFDKVSLAVEKNIYLTKIVNIYIISMIMIYVRKSYQKYKFKNCLFGATNIIKASDKEEYVYGGFGITFNGGSFWRFAFDTARNVIIFGFDNVSSSQANNRKNNF